MRAGIKCIVAIQCVDENDEILYEGGDDMYLAIPPWANNDKQMEAIHLEANARQQLVVTLRRMLSENPECFPKKLQDAFVKNDWQVKVRVSRYPDHAY